MSCQSPIDQLTEGCALERLLAKACVGTMVDNGVVFQMLTLRMGFDAEALLRRLAQRAEVVIKPIDAADISSIGELLGT